MEFIPNSQEVMVQQLNRRQNTNTVWTANIQTMELSKILIDEDEAFWIYMTISVGWKERNFLHGQVSETDGCTCIKFPEMAKPLN